jgi:hypothetical protein
MNATDYLNLWVCYGGLWERVGTVYREMGSAAGIWLAGYELSGGQFHSEKPV